MVNIQQISDWARHYTELGNEQKSTLELLVRQYPWFGTLHILLAKAYKNEDSKLFNGALKKAALYTGDRSLLYDLMHNQLEAIHVVSMVEDEVKVEVKAEVEVEGEVEVEVEAKVEDEDEVKVKVEEGYEDMNEMHSILESAGIDFEPEETNTIEEKEDDEVEVEVLNETNSIFETVDVDLEPEENIAEIGKEENEVEDLQEKPSILESVEVGFELAENKTNRGREKIEAEESDDDDEIPSIDLNKSEYPRFKVLYDPLEALKPKDEPVEPEEVKPVKKEPVIVYDPEKELAPAGEESEDIEHDFSYWLDHFTEKPKPEPTPTSSDAIDLLNKFLENRPSISRPKAEFFKPENMAKKSEEFHLDIATETLAKVLVRQGHKQRAIEVYEKLMLQNPNNSAFFAAQIEKLRTE